MTNWWVEKERAFTWELKASPQNNQKSMDLPLTDVVLQDDMVGVQDSSKRHTSTAQLDLMVHSAPDRPTPLKSLVYDYWKNHSFDYMDLFQQWCLCFFHMLSRFIIVFLPRSKCLLTSRVQSPSAVIFGAQENKVCHCFQFFLSICHKVMGPDASILVFWMLSFKLAFSLFSFTFIKRFFSSS